MLSTADFLTSAKVVLGLTLNAAQESAIVHPLDPALMLVAGPGSGKTTVLVLRALRHILVDAVPPEEVVITTFTRKAAAELRSRLLDWGLRLVAHWEVAAASPAERAAIKALDINLCRTGTLDSFCQDWLGNSGAPGTPRPVILEEFAARFIFARAIFAPIYRAPGNEALLCAYYAPFTHDGTPPRTQGDSARVAVAINDRLIQDLADAAAYASLAGPALVQRQLQRQLLDQFQAHLKNNTLFNFSMSATEVLRRLQAGEVFADGSGTSTVTPIRCLLVDEYQDTNPLQEAIYFEIAKNKAVSLTVVGDDDQALYRFRGATVELFTNFANRYSAQTGRPAPANIFLVNNYRSTPRIVDYFNRFVVHDPEYGPARVVGKPAIVAQLPPSALPVLGLFRDSAGDLAVEIADLTQALFSPSGFKVPGTDLTLQTSPDARLGDFVYLGSTVAEISSGGNDRLPVLLRREFAMRGLAVFNPRGQALKDIPNVQILLGLVAECVDPATAMESTLPLTRVVQTAIPLWRTEARAFMATNPSPRTSSKGLPSFVAAWKNRASTGSWPSEVPLLDLLYKLIVWLPAFQHDSEHQIYLEAIMRCVTQAANFSPYDMNVLRGAGGVHDDQSAKAVFRDLLSPIAEGVIEVDEDLLFSPPRNRLNIMTIHQAKGLEFPVVIVDVGSDFQRDHPKQRFRRFPDNASPTVALETHLAPYSPVGSTRTGRPEMDRTFDDLRRLYYVAYSRPQSVLILVGLTKLIQYQTKIRHVATFWRQPVAPAAGTWSWQAQPPASKPVPPFPEFLPQYVHLI